MNYLTYCTTLKHYNDFEKAIMSFDNSKIEKTRLYQALTELLSAPNKPFQRTIRKNEIFYRARVIDDFTLFNPENGISKKDNKFTGLNSYQSKEPPLGVSNDGRNNICGASYLYLSKDKYTACVEVCPNRGTLISLATFAANKSLHVVDLATNDNVSPIKHLAQENSFDASRLITLVMEKYCEPKSNNSSYVFSQFVSDMFRKKGFDGIVYASSYTRKQNLTLFNCDESFIKFKESNLVFCSSKMPCDIYDLSTYKRLTPKCHKLSKIELENNAAEIEKTLKERVKQNGE